MHNEKISECDSQIRVIAYSELKTLNWFIKQDFICNNELLKEVVKYLLVWTLSQVFSALLLLNLEKGSLSNSNRLHS